MTLLLHYSNNTLLFRNDDASTWESVISQTMDTLPERKCFVPRGRA